jgi:glycosyltransferase involved in cell wall biosynthesis
MTRLLIVDSGMDLPAARVHRDLLRRHLSDGNTSFVEAKAWLASMLPDGQHVASSLGAKAFAEATATVDVVMPSHECLPFMPAICELRNRAASPVRFVVISHSPAVHPLEWALLARFLASGDAIVAPTHSAARQIAAFATSLESFVRVVPHPIEPPAVERKGSGARLVSLSRVTPHKLQHRTLDAMALLPAPLRARVRLDIAGSTGPSADHTYANALRHRADRLGVGPQVRFFPELAPEEKWRLLSQADVLINPSIDRAESFGMAAVEAMAIGIPVLTTAWDGLIETVGHAGRCVPVHDARPGAPVDVDAGLLALALEDLLTQSVDPETCRVQAQRCAPQRAVEALRMVVDGAVGDESGPVLSDVLDVDACPDPSSFMAEALSGVEVGAAFEACLSVPGSAVVSGSRNGWALRKMVTTALDAPIARTMAGLPVDLVADAASAEIARGFDALERGNVADARAYLASIHRTVPGASGERFLAASCDIARGRWQEAMSSILAVLEESRLGEHSGPWLCLAARAARHAGRPEVVIHQMIEWLEAHPDGPGSAATWAALCATAAAAGDTAAAGRALTVAEALVGKTNPLIEQLADSVRRLDEELVSP